MANFPTGIVTFLYTDIEGSTRLWEQQPDAMAMAIARHDAVVRRAIESGGGLIFRLLTGGSCAAVQRQQTLQALIDWSYDLLSLLECLGFIAGIQARDTDEPLPLLRRAATLFAAADVIRRANNSPMHPWEQIEYDGHVKALREMLDPRQFAAAWHAGQRMDLDQSVIFATDAA